MPLAIVSTEKSIVPLPGLNLLNARRILSKLVIQMFLCKAHYILITLIL